MLRKLCSILLLLSILFAPLSSVQAEMSESEQLFMTAKIELLGTKNGASYIATLNDIIPQFPNQRLVEVQGRVQEAIGNPKFNSYMILLHYIDVAIERELQERFFENSLSLPEQETARTEILEMQAMMGDSIENMMNQLMLSWEQMSNYEETGDLSMNMSLNVDAVDIKAGLDFSDYSATTSGFNQEIQGEIEAFLQGVIDGEDVDVQIQTLLDFITVEGNMYVLMENLKLIDGSEKKEFAEEMKPFIEKMQELGESKTYLSLEDADAEVLLEMFQSLSRDTIQAELDTILKTPLFEAYQKEGNIYSLRPTKHACDTGKRLSQVFDPFYDDNICNASQYENLLKDLQDEDISITLEISDTNILLIGMDDGNIQGNLSVEWRDTVLEKIQSNFFDPQNPEINNISFTYLPSESLTAKFMAEEEVEMNLSMIFSNSGALSTMDMDFMLEDVFNISARFANENLDVDISGGTSESRFMCSVNGKITMGYTNLDGNCDIESEAISYIFPDETTMDIASKLIVDTRSGKNNIDMNINVNAGTTQVMTLNVENTGTRRSINPARIPVPINTINMQEAFSEIYGNMYSDQSVDYDPYYKTDEITGEQLICLEYVLNEETDYEDCVRYVADTYDYDDYYKTDDKGKSFYCDEYKYDEEKNYDYCVNYIAE